ncbi:uncharacterized protein LOC134541046 [Bacillus rossius redtenbacheri]|uniref:uncharacterized protein LOC134541046 n=1 Tax=Bacillus rossius redtenbacheri TaxID=93214 RepID=UPI002FDCAECE
MRRRGDGRPSARLLALLAVAVSTLVVLYGLLPAPRCCGDTRADRWPPSRAVPFFQASDPAKKPFLVWSAGCKIPNVDPFHESLRPLMAPPRVANCSEWTQLTAVSPAPGPAGRFQLRVDQGAAALYSTPGGQLSCCYSTASRPAPVQPPASTRGKKHDGGADARYELTNCTYFEEETLLPPGTEFILVRCFTRVLSVFSKEVYSNMHAMVPIKASVLRKMKTKKRTKALQDTSSDSLSVLLLGIDATSRLNLIRKLPSTFTYLKRNSWFEMAGYNKVGLNTFPNIFPLLTGLRIHYPKNGTCFPSQDRFLDGCPFLWRNYSERGFVTAYGEDAPDISTFNFHKVGFSEQPTDYYLRAYMLVLYRKIISRFSNSWTSCFDMMEITDHVLRYAGDFAATFRKRPFFGMFWLNNFSHDDHNNIAAFDAKFLDFFSRLQDVGVMNKTMVVFFSDHGMRFGKIAEHPLGRLEDKLPFLYIWLPEWFRDQNELAARNLRINGGRLTSPFDVYRTLKYNLVRSESTDEGDESWNKHYCKTSINLFKEVPVGRSCEDACIPPEWCSCAWYHDIPNNDLIGVAALKYVVSRLKNIVSHTHKLTNHTAAVCAQLSLEKVVKISKKTDENSAEVGEYLLQFETSPGNGVFEAMVRHYPEESNFQLVGDINRLSRYGNQSWCVDDSVLKNYCFCEMT